MSRDFKYKDFVNKLRFQVGGVCPTEFSEYGEKYIKEAVYKYSMTAAEALYKEPSANVETCEIITQTVAEWTFHKVIDLMHGEIPESFHSIVLQKINYAIYECMIEINKSSEITYQSLEEDNSFLAQVETIVKDTYRDALAQIYSDRGIDKDTYTWALEQSHIDIMETEDDEDQSENVKKDKFNFKKRSTKTNRQFYFDLWVQNPILYTVYLIFIPLAFIYVLIHAKHGNSKGVFFYEIFSFIATIRFCWLLIEGLRDLNEEKKIEYETKAEEYEDLKDFMSPNCMYERLGVDILSFQVGEGLVDYSDPEADNELLPRIAKLRKELTDNLGYIIPNVRCLDNNNYKPYECGIYIRNTRRDTFFVEKDCSQKRFGRIVEEHMRKCFIKYANDIITKTDILKLMELVRSQDPTLVNDLIPELLSAVDLRRILVTLVKEEIPIKDVVLIFERLCDFARFNKEPDILAERLRAEMAPQICERYGVEIDGTRVIYALTFTSKNEKLLDEALQRTELGAMFLLNPEEIEEFTNQTLNALDNLKEHREEVVLLVSPRIRLPLFEFISRHTDVGVMSYSELTTDVHVEVLGEI